MHTSQDHRQKKMYIQHQTAKPYSIPHFQIIDNSNNILPNNNPIRGEDLSFSGYNENEGFFTLDSAPSTYYQIPNNNNSPAMSTSSNRSSFSPQRSQSYVSDPQHYSEHSCESAASGSSVVDNDVHLMNKMREFHSLLDHPKSGSDSPVCLYNTLEGGTGGGVAAGGGPNEASSAAPRWDCQQIKGIGLQQDVRQVLLLCAKAVADEDLEAAGALMETLGQMVSVVGTPVQRLAAYMLEGLRARLEFSGYNIYKKLRCDPPTSEQLRTYMGILYMICPYYQFAYKSSNMVILEAMENEPFIHIIDFQIAMGTQWMDFIRSVANRPGGPPFIRVTGVDDSNSAYARGGGLEIVGNRLSEVAQSCRVPFEFHAVAVEGCRVGWNDLKIQPGEAVAVTFAFMLHHMPDESVSTDNHRDRLLRLIKSLSPKVVTLIEQESNTNTAPFFNRFSETLDYYTAMFESIDVARPRNDKERINAEQHCLARDIVNMIACEGAERVERHELLGKWKARLSMAGFSQYPLSSSVCSVGDLLKGFHENYRFREWEGSLYLGWKTRWLATMSAWR